MKHPVVVRALLAGAFTLAALSAPAQQIWKWRDASGQMHISDQPPPAGAAVGQKPVVSATPASPAPAAEPASAASGPRASVDPELARRKAEADKKKLEQDAAQKDAQKKQDAIACAAAQEQLRTINSGMRLMRVNAQGEREYLDDNQRAAQAKQAQSVVDKSCH